MADLNVIALISGGKDSLFSILHCIRQNHNIVALANLYPPESTNTSTRDRNGEAGSENKDEEEEEDMNSYMYQTVGHTLIPLYASALKLPLYRQPILGSASMSKEYDVTLPVNNNGSPTDETESLMPLLERIMKAHPEANAISTGAILSTYQRTRVESVALRLGLTPLSYLWQYPILPPYTQAGLLRDMAAVGQDARIIKVASGGLDESYLWQNVADPKTIARLSRAMARFGENGDGAVLGEGGEFETLAVDGPRALWKGRIEVESAGVVHGEGGSAVWKGEHARVVQKEEQSQDEHESLSNLRVPPIWDDEFERVLKSLDDLPDTEESSNLKPAAISPSAIPRTGNLLPTNFIHTTTTTLVISNLTALQTPTTQDTSTSAVRQLQTILSTLSTHLKTHGLASTSILHTTLLLRHISDFALLNPVYSTFFPSSLPPSRVTVSCGEQMPEGVHVILSAIISLADGRQKQGLHVQSRSYWAPANIGPYSQAISIPIPHLSPTASSSSSTIPRSPEDEHPDTLPTTAPIHILYPAGQIPLFPSTMQLHPHPSSPASFLASAALALQHLWRIGRAMRVSWWTAGLAYISDCADSEAQMRVRTAQAIWRGICAHYLVRNSRPESENGEGEDGDVDPWDLRNRVAGLAIDDATHCTALPDPKVLRGEAVVPPCYIVQVSQLPREADIEWHSLGISMPSSSFASSDHRIETRKVRIGQDIDGYLYLTSITGTSTTLFSYEIGSKQDGGAEEGEAEEVLRFKQLFMSLVGGSEEKGNWVCEHATLYASPFLGSEWARVLNGMQWVPCRRVWGEHGREVNGVVVGRLSSVGR